MSLTGANVQGGTSAQSEMATKMTLRQGEVIDLDRHKFQVGKLAARGAMSSLYIGTCIEGKSTGKQVLFLGSGVIRAKW